MVAEHTAKAFDADIDQLRSNVLKMGGLVERQVARAVDGIRLMDLGLVAAVLQDEEVVNRLHVQTDLMCNQVIARRQPIAVDLREIIAILHMINDLERIGDEAKKIALKVRRFEGAALPISLAPVSAMADEACDMLRLALDAFVRGMREGWGMGESLARDLDARDDLAHPDLSLLLQSWRGGVPYTLHPALGAEIIHQHPAASGAAIGDTGHRDFRRLAGGPGSGCAPR